MKVEIHYANQILPLSPRTFCRSLSDKCYVRNIQPALKHGHCPFHKRITQKPFIDELRLWAIRKTLPIGEVDTWR